MEHDPSWVYRGPVGVVFEPFGRTARRRGWFERSRAAWKVHRLIWRVTRSDRALVDGHDLQLDRFDALGIGSGQYERAEGAWYRAHVSPGDVVVEVGANIGFFTLELARLVGPAGRVISYEPDPDLCAILRRNVEANGYSQVEIRQAAASDHPGTLTLYRSPDNTGDGRLFAHAVDAGSVPVDVVTLDEDLAGIGERIDLLKMDIQGSEPRALRGMRERLREHPPRRMLVEFWPHGITGMGDDPAAMVEVLREAGYALTTLEGAELDLDDALRRLTPANRDWVNLVATLQETS